MTLRVEPKVIKGDAYLFELAEDLKIPGEYTTAGRIMRWVLHNLRNKIEKNVSYKILSHLPPYLRMIYVDQWEIFENYQENYIEADDITELYEDATGKKIPRRIAERWAIKAVFRVVGRFVSNRDFEEVYNSLPEKYKYIILEDALPNPV